MKLKLLRLILSDRKRLFFVIFVELIFLELIFLQHTPMISTRKGEITIHDGIAKFPKLRPLEGFSEEVPSHIIGRAMFNSDLTSFNTVSNEKIANIKVPGAFSTGDPTIFSNKIALLLS
jgi:hypothetical protein